MEGIGEKKNYFWINKKWKVKQAEKTFRKNDSHKSIVLWYTESHFHYYVRSSIIPFSRFICHFSAVFSTSERENWKVFRMHGNGCRTLSKQNVYIHFKFHCDWGILYCFPLLTTHDCDCDCMPSDCWCISDSNGNSKHGKWHEISVLKQSI